MTRFIICSKTLCTGKELCQLFKIPFSLHSIVFVCFLLLFVCLFFVIVFFSLSFPLETGYTFILNQFPVLTQDFISVEKPSALTETKAEQMRLNLPQDDLRHIFFP